MHLLFLRLHQEVLQPPAVFNVVVIVPRKLVEYVNINSQRA